MKTTAYIAAALACFFTAVITDKPTIEETRAKFALDPVEISEPKESKYPIADCKIQVQDYVAAGQLVGVDESNGTALVMTSKFAFAEADPELEAVRATRNPSACRVSYDDGRSSWCGSGAVAGYDAGGNALIATNAHVSGNPTARAQRTIRVVIDGQSRNFDATEVVAYGYSNQRAVDWAILRSTELTEDMGIPATPLFKGKPTDNLQFTGSPRCVWPQTNIDVRLVPAQGVPDGVRFWTPNSIGGQSGSNLRATVDSDNWVGQILLTWTWGGRGAGQETFQVFNNVINRSTDGEERDSYKTPEVPGGLQEVYFWKQGEPYDQQEGYYEKPAISVLLGNNKAERLAKVAELPIWYDPNTDPGPGPDPDGDLTKAEIDAMVKLKNKGMDLIKISDHYLSLFATDTKAQVRGFAPNDPTVELVLPAQPQILLAPPTRVIQQIP